GDLAGTKMSVEGGEEKKNGDMLWSTARISLSEGEDRETRENEM
ncbi:hypothetical protein A2U01_0097161, partial [Trifolium medium]|nr:hypothetical protein [Trifolium medium]